jgi:hypothetical protein
MRRSTSVSDVVSLIKTPDRDIALLDTVYTNSLLATLNARNSMSRTIDDTSRFPLSIPTTGTRVTDSTLGAKSYSNLSIRFNSINTTKTQDVHDDASWNGSMLLPSFGFPADNKSGDR